MKGDPPAASTRLLSALKVTTHVQREKPKAEYVKKPSAGKWKRGKRGANIRL